MSALATDMLVALVLLTTLSFTHANTNALSDTRWPSATVSQLPLPLVVGHRGYSGRFPENTLEAFHGAWSAGADGFETDLRLTSDNVIVLMHDSTLDRTTNCTGTVASHTLAEIRTCNAAPADGRAARFVPVPTFLEAVELATSKDMFIVMDLKAYPLGVHIAKVFAQAGVDGGSMVASCWTETAVADIRAHLNVTVKQKLSYSDIPQGKNATDAYFDNLLLEGVHGFSLFIDYITVPFIKKAYARLMPIFSWTVNSREDMELAVHQNHAGVITNEVADMVNVRHEMLARLSSACPASEGADSSTQGAEIAATAVVCTLISVAVTVVAMKAWHKRQLRGYQQRLHDDDAHGGSSDQEHEAVNISYSNSPPPTSYQSTTSQE